MVIIARRQISSCLTCSIVLTGPWQRLYCSVSCGAKAQAVLTKKLPMNKCEHCGALHKNRRFCSRVCSGKSSNPPLPLEEGIARRRLSNRLATRKYVANLRAQCPPDADLVLIREIYAKCPVGHEVDHIIPISKGGLHHQDNLQYLTCAENRRKGSKLGWQGRNLP